MFVSHTVTEDKGIQLTVRSDTYFDQQSLDLSPLHPPLL